MDQARAARDVALAQIARTKAVIAKKVIRAPFRARVGIADVHPGQYLDEGTELTTLQGVDDAAHVDFTVAQRVAAGLRVGDSVGVTAGSDSVAGSPPASSRWTRGWIPRPATRRSAQDRRRRNAPSPGASVRVLVPVGPPRKAVVVPVSALRKGPAGDHVFVIAAGQDRQDPRALRPVESGPVLGDEVLILGGLAAGEQVATLGLVQAARSGAGRGRGLGQDRADSTQAQPPRTEGAE